VFSSPLTHVELRDIGMAPDVLARVARRVAHLWIDAPGGASFALTYGHQGNDTPTALGFDRSALDPCLLEMAAVAGVDVRRGATVTTVDAAGGRPILRVRTAGRESVVRARVLVGADGIRSTVARSLGVTRPSPVGLRVGLTYHVDADEFALPRVAGGDADGHMVVLDGAYCGFAPVPGDRVNVGIVIAARRRRARLADLGARGVADSILREARRRAIGVDGAPAPLEPIAGASPIAHQVARAAGSGWLLAGDSAGFIDPFTGEGLHRALVSARLADRAVATYLRGRSSALADYDAAMRRRFNGKDVMSWMAQVFLSRPDLFDYAARRLVARPSLRHRLGLLMGDLVPASGAVDPRFILAVLRP
jgi:flavin-dependent dehydrogenase